MNQSLLHAEVLLRHQARERERHVEEGRVLRALDAAASGRGSRPRGSSTGTFGDPFAIRAGICRLWRGPRFRLPGDTRKPRLGSGSA
jgi:hypothetical protein